MSGGEGCSVSGRYFFLFRRRNFIFVCRVVAPLAGEDAARAHMTCNRTDSRCYCSPPLENSGIVFRCVVRLACTWGVSPGGAAVSRSSRGALSYAGRDTLSTVLRNCSVTPRRSDRQVRSTTSRRSQIGTTSQDRTRLGKTRQDMTRQGRTRQDKTKT